MLLTTLLAMLKKDLLVFFADRRAIIMGFAAPIAIASFFGAIFPGPGGSNRTARITVRIADEDGSAIARAIVAAAQDDRNVAVTAGSAEEAALAVRRGDASVAVIIPKGFGTAASAAFTTGSDRPALRLVYDPSRATDLAMVRALLTEHVMRAVTASTRGFDLPYEIRDEAAGPRKGRPYNGYAHSFAGMGVQFLMLAAVDLAVAILLERERGLWKRVRSAPVSRIAVLGGKLISATLITLLTLLVSFGFAMAVFGVRIEGSVVGFLAVAVSCALMASTFGLFVAALGNAPGPTRGLAMLGVLLMVMLGGAWVPTFIFPAWLQQLAVVVPARWAVDGLDAMTWRGFDLGAAVAPTLVLLGFAALFAALALARFRWEER